MTKETKNTVAAETIVKELEKYAKELQDTSVEAIETSLKIEDPDTFASANIIHSVSYSLKAILAGETADEALRITFLEDEDKVVKNVVKRLFEKWED